MALFRKNIEWVDDSRNTLVYKYPFKEGGREVNNKSKLTVRESQVAIFVHKGKIADIFEPGLYDVDSEIFPILTKLAAWKYKFETPITLDVFFVNTKQFTSNKWGTPNPIMMRDPEFGAIRVRGFGSYAFSVDKPDNFLRELFGTNSTFKTEDIVDHLKSLIVSSLSDALGESKVSALDLAGNTQEFQEIVSHNVKHDFEEIGLKLTKFIIENMSVPEEVEKALDERSKLGILGDKTDVMMKIAAAEAMKDAANNPGMAGGFMGAGVGVGAGVGIGQMFADAMRSQPQQQAQPQSTMGAAVVGAGVAGAAQTECPKCGAKISKTSKFCPECGEKMNVKKFCPECGAEISGGKFCPECGHKI